MRVLLTAMLSFAVISCAGMPEGADNVGRLAPADTLMVEAFGPTFRDARSVAADPQGRLYVSDAGADVVVTLDTEGSARTTLGGPGSGDYAFLGPAGMDPTNGLVLYVADSGNGRIQRFSHEGRFLESIPVPADPEPVLGRGVENAERGRPVGVTVAPAGEVYVVEAMRGVVLLFDERRNLVRVVGAPGDGRGALMAPVGVALDRDARLLVADAAHRSVLVYDAYGEFLRRIADGIAADVRGVAAGRSEIAVVLRDGVLLYDLEGMLRRRLTVVLDESIVDAVITERGLVLLTRSRLWRVVG